MVFWPCVAVRGGDNPLPILLPVHRKAAAEADGEDRPAQRSAAAAPAWASVRAVKTLLRHPSPPCLVLKRQGNPPERRPRAPSPRPRGCGGPRGPNRAVGGDRAAPACFSPPVKRSRHKAPSRRSRGPGPASAEPRPLVPLPSSPSAPHPPHDIRLRHLIVPNKPIALGGVRAFPLLRGQTLQRCRRVPPRRRQDRGHRRPIASPALRRALALPTTRARSRRRKGKPRRPARSSGFAPRRCRGAGASSATCPLVAGGGAARGQTQPGPGRRVLGHLTAGGASAGFGATASVTSCERHCSSPCTEGTVTAHRA